MGFQSIPTEIVKAGQSAREAEATYGQAASQEPSITDVLRQKIIEAYNANQDVIVPLDVATKTYLGAPQQAREKYQDIFNPFQRENLVSQYVGNESLPMLSLSSILGQRMGRVEDTLGAGTRAYSTMVSARQAAAQAKRQAYLDKIDEYKLSQPDTQVIEANGRKLLINSLTGETISDLGYSGGGGGGTVGERASSSARAALLRDVLNGETVENLIPRYAQSLELYEIMDIYNSNSPYKQAKQSGIKLNAMYQASNSSSPEEDWAAALLEE